MSARQTIALISALFLGACASTASLETLRVTPASGNAYQVALANDYLDYAEGLAANYEWSLANYFAEKGLHAAQGNEVDPEDVAAWPFEQEPPEELTAMRSSLVAAIAANRTTQPELTASALVAYDRWLVLVQQGWQSGDVAEQRDILAALLAKLEEAHIASPSAPPPPPTVASESDRIVLYFPFDSDRLGDSALGALKDLARGLATTTSLSINGHADRAGSEPYNMSLSERRARFVLKSLEQAGISGKQMKHYAFGETDPAVATDDGVPEPKNRRVEITIEP